MKDTLLILASGSPRRRELLGVLGMPFEVRAAGVDETPNPDEAPEACAQRLAREKATPPPAPPLLKKSAGEGRETIVIAADTIVVLDGEILGKPRDAAEAAAMLRRLRGRAHEVMSAIAVVNTATGERREALCRSEVRMREYSEAEIAGYVAGGDPLDKAGAYAIQHDGFRPAQHFNHCYASVMGLPLCHLTRALRQLGAEPPADVPAACQQFNNYQCPVYKEILEPQNTKTPRL